MAGIYLQYTSFLSKPDLGNLGIEISLHMLTRNKKKKNLLQDSSAQMVIQM